MSKPLPQKLRGVVFATLGALLCVGLIVFFGHQRKEINDLTAENTSLRLQASKQLPHVSVDRRIVRDETLSVPTRGETKSDVSVTPPAQSIIYRDDVAQRYPGFADLLQKDTRRGMLSKCNQMLRLLNLKPEDEKKLRDLIVEEFNCLADAQEIARKQGLAPGTPAYYSLFESTRQSVDTAIKDLVGQFDYERVMRSPIAQKYLSDVTSTFAVDFEDAGVPLTEVQTLALADTMAKAFGTYPTPLSDSIGESLSKAEQNLLDQASHALSAPQLGALRSRLIEDRRQATIMRNFPKDTLVLP
jgi:hypothetical protein